MQNIAQRILAEIEGYVPNLLAAIAVIALGWVAALLVAALVRSAARRVTAGEAVSTALKPDATDQFPPLGVWLSRTVFWAIMIVVITLAFQILNFTALSGPLDVLLQQVLGYLPKLVGAGVLLLVAWVVGAVLRLVVARGLARTSLDQKVAETAGFDPQRPLSRTLGEVVFWLPLLLIFPAVLGVLALDGLLTPLQGMFDSLLGVLPNLLAAGLILLLGWFVARLLRRTVAALVSAAGGDRLGERVGMGPDAGPRRLSAVVGLLVYALILIPAVIAALDALRLESVSRPATLMLQNILTAVPLLFGAAVLLGIAYLVGRAVAGLVTSLLTGVGFDGIFERLGLALGDRATRTTPSQVAGTLTLVAIMLLASIEAATVLGFGALADLVVQFFGFASRLLLALIIFGIGLYLGNLAHRAIPRGDGRWSALLPAAARVAVVVLATAMALQQMQVGQQIVTIAFGVVIGAIGVAVAIAFGIGGHESARKMVKEWVEEPRKS